MNRKIFIVITVFLLIACVGIAAVRTGKVSPEIWRTAKAVGLVKVIVGLNVPTELLATLSQEARLAQQQAITAGQDALLTELAGTTYRVTGRFKYNPGLALEVGQDALAVLERSTRVTDVKEDRPARMN